MIPELPSHIGGKGNLKDIDGIPQEFEIIDEIVQDQTIYPQKDIQEVRKKLVLQKLKFYADQRIELRLGYYIIGKKEGMKGKWVWGQYCTMMPEKDFKSLMDKAKNKGFI